MLLVTIVSDNILSSVYRDISVFIVKGLIHFIPSKVTINSSALNSIVRGYYIVL